MVTKTWETQQSTTIYKSKRCGTTGMCLYLQITFEGQ